MFEYLYPTTRTLYSAYVHCVEYGIWISQLLSRRSNDKVHDGQVGSCPVVLCPCKPNQHRRHQNETHNRTAIVHVGRRDWQRRGKRKPDDGVRSVKKRKDVDVQPPATPIPSSQLEIAALAVPCVEHAADGDEVADEEGLRAEGQDRAKGDVTGCIEIEQTQQADDEDGEDDASNRHTLLWGDLVVEVSLPN